MRCQDVTRRLASLEAGPDSLPSDLAAHVASCPSCAGWSRKAARLDRAWEATRPPEPSADALDALWAKAALALDAGPRTIRFERLARRRRIVALVTAQAAVVIVGALLVLRQVGTNRPDPSVAVRDSVPNTRPMPTTTTTPKSNTIPILIPTPLKLVVDQDQMVIVRIGPDAPKVERHDQAELFASNALPGDTPHDIFNAWESVATR